MYTIKQTLNSSNILECIEIENPEKTCYAKIHVNEGASLQELKLEGKTIIEDLHPLTYNNTYASSILFPFANRIKDGAYTYDGNEFKFEINEAGNNNALHGLVYNKTFKIINQKETNDFASITFEYVQDKESIGFPYTFSMQLEYIIKKNSVDIHVSVKNTDAKAFPFTLGWHPYFSSSDLYNSTLNFDSNKQLIFDERCITTGVSDINNEAIFEVKDKKLDDCFILNTNQTQFNTPHYKLLISASSEENFLQIYTPPKANVIAIEPTTGVSDSFNNKIGLQILKPNESHQLNWNVKLI
ncbi:aldose 1-epimerase [Mariniflexile fucanivorans]|uniref:Aldose 1-epimerase n=1 Tax=Mariniflexile fucanivorans TaxID=264023 RepID=A0A4V6NGY0_9FLAO|nr:aldose 1-epimerase [Mariniflexile fucanivorans]TCL67657.1 aldose 1-epimerase [Mariniflexile fucanivorans]